MADEPSGAERAIAWHEIHTPDPASTSDFYAQVMGWEVETRPMGGEAYTMFAVDGKPFSGICRANEPEWEGAPAYWTVYFNCQDVDAAVGRAEELDGTIVIPPYDVPGVGRMALIEDPDGATFYLFQEE